MIEKIKGLSAKLNKILQQDDKEMVIISEKSRKIIMALNSRYITRDTQNPIKETTTTAQLRKNPMFRSKSFELEDSQEIDLLIDSLI